MANVKITSIFTNATWEGEIDPVRDLGMDDPNPSAYRYLEAVFRFTNRVTDEDVQRLRQLGYTLPSMSVGDSIRVGDTTFYVHPIGFQRYPCDALGQPDERLDEDGNCSDCGYELARCRCEWRPDPHGGTL